ncbi:hypothetical protein ACB092_11G017700 [Castanea dentata]
MGTMFSFHDSRAFLFLSLVVFALTSYINSQPEPIYNYHYCSVGLGSLEQANDDYLSNLTVLLDSLSSKASQNYSFYKAISNKTGIYGLFLCRGDVSQYTCQTCVSYVSNYIKTRCPEPSFGALGLMNNLRDEVLETEMLFRAGNMSVGNGNGFRYGLVQCTRDINSTQCGNCLQILIEKVQDCCQARTVSNNNPKLLSKGKLSNGQEIAVKRLSMKSRQGDLEFKNEVLLVVKLQHRNLIRLLGFCIEGNERLRIYEFVPNISLGHFIFDPTKRAQLGWERRYQIIRGIARGILYLNEDSRLRIIHRDLKTRNILLDAEMTPKISDFGMEKLFVPDQTKGCTNRIVGYMAPEYARTRQFSVKSDIFSFGVLILEIVSGQKITCLHNGEDREYLLSYAWKSWMEGTATNLIDPTLRDSQITEIMRCIHTGLLCVQKQPVARPNMTSVVAMINRDSITLPVPTQPADFTRRQSVVVLNTPLQQDIGSHVTKYELAITELYPR